MVETGCYFQLVDEYGRILDFSLGDTFDDPQPIGKHPLLGHIDHPVCSSTQFLHSILFYSDELKVILDLIFVIINEELLLEEVRFHHYLLY